jgi:hypothetical protein
VLIVNEPIVKLECYEPAGASLDFTPADLLGHTLAIGGSGSGKTSRLILPMVSQLIHSGDIGLCILDTKADGVAEHSIRHACFDADRDDDFVVIKGAGDNYLQLFSEIIADGFTGIDALSALLGSTIPRAPQNKYWEKVFESLLRQSLRLIHLTENQEWSYNTLMQQITRYLLLHQLRDPAYTEIIDSLKEIRDIDAPHRQSIIDEVVATHRMWDTLDFRTRSILQSMATSLTSVMNSKITHSFFSGESPIDIASSVRDQKIILISIDGIRNPEAARLISCIIKGLFYSAVLQNDPHCGSESISGLVLDDWPICITSGTGNRYSDIDALAMIRSRGGFIIAATQSLAAIDTATDQPSRAAALANFANLVFFRGRDPETDAIAAAYLGTKTEVLTDTTFYEGNSPTVRRNFPSKFLRQIRTAAVPLGAIARLSTGDAYALIGPNVYNQALSLIPHKTNNIPL